MSAVFSGLLPFRSAEVALTGATATTCYTVGDDGEDEIILAGVEVVDSTGSVSTAASIVHYRDKDAASFVIVPASVGLPTATESLVYECIPGRHMRQDDEIRVTGASGHHVCVSFWKISPTPRGAQRI